MPLAEAIAEILLLDQCSVESDWIAGVKHGAWRHRNHRLFWSSDGAEVAASFRDGSVRLYRCHGESLTETLELRTPRSQIFKIFFLP